jgi:ribonuclease P protein subunit POP4
VKIRLSPESIQNTGQHELIGLQVVVESARCPEYSQIQGRIIDESRNMITVFDGYKKRRVPKAEVTFLVTLSNDRRIRLQGQRIIGRPEDRIKTYRRKRK